MNSAYVLDMEHCVFRQFYQMEELSFFEKLMNPISEENPNIMNAMRTVERLYQGNPKITLAEHHEKMYAFQYEEYVQKAYQVLSDTYIEYRYLLNKVKLHYKKLNITEDELIDYFTMHRPKVECDESVLGRIYQLLVGKNSRIKLGYLTQDKQEDILVYCKPEHIPEEILLLTSRIDQIYDLRYFMHELGHAISLANTFSGLETLKSYLYNEMMQEAYADLFENLVIYNRDFQNAIGTRLSITEVYHCFFEDLYRYRLMAAKVIYQYEYYSTNHQNDLQDFYHELMRKSLLVESTNKAYTIDPNTGFSTMQQFIGRLISDEIKTVLEHNYGTSWFRYKSFSKTLSNLFRNGGLVTPNNYRKYLV